MTAMYLPVLLYLVITMGLIGVLVVLSGLIGERKATRQKLLPYDAAWIPSAPWRSTFRSSFTCWP